MCLHDSLEVAYVMGSFCIFEPFYGLGAVGKGSHDPVVWRDFRVGDVFVLELDCIADTIAARWFDVTLVCAVMLIRSG